MASAIEQLRSGLAIGHAQLGLHGAQQGSINQQVHDGDTIETQLDGNVGVRFLGVDAPEVSFTLPGHEGFTPIANPAWEPFLADPFAASLPPSPRRCPRSCKPSSPDGLALAPRPTTPGWGRRPPARCVIWCVPTLRRWGKRMRASGSSARSRTR
jgi:hypothetical protein